jgi:aminotransferase
MQINRAKRMEQLPTQFFAGLVAKVNERVTQGHDVINLGQGNPDMPTPDGIVESLRDAVLDPKTHRYSPFHGLKKLRLAAAHFYATQYQVELDYETEVAVLFGGKAGLVELSQIYLNPLDVALVPDPGYPDYLSGIALAGGAMARIPLHAERGFLPDFEQITPDVWHRAKLMFLNYPNNPTGAVANSLFFEQVVQLARAHETLVVHDFAYGAISFDGYKHPSFLQTDGAKAVGVEIYTLSKTYNMAGWRVAVAVGNADVIADLNLLQDHLFVSLFPAVQLAATAALEGSQESVRHLVATYQSRRDAFLKGLADYGMVCPRPSGSFFVWLPVPKGFSSLSFTDFLLNEADVAVAPGVGFGEHGEGYVRVGLLATEERLVEAAHRIGNALKLAGTQPSR